MSSRNKNRMNREMLEYLIAQATSVLSEDQMAKFKEDLIRVAMDSTSDSAEAFKHVQDLFEKVLPRASARQQAELRREFEEQNRPVSRPIKVNSRRSHGRTNHHWQNNRGSGTLLADHLPDVF